MTSSFHTLGNPNYQPKRRFDPDLGDKVNKEVEAEERRKKLEAKLKAKRTPEEPATPESLPESILETININITPEDYILLEGRTHGTYSYNDLLVSKYRLPATPEVIQIAQQLGFQVADTAKENSGRGYIGNINWEQAIKLNLSLGGNTLTIRQYVDFLKLLSSGKAFDGKGNKISNSKLIDILNEITEVRDPWRSEHLNAKFENKNNILYINHSNNTDANGNLSFQSQPLEQYLMKDKIPGIDFNYWLNNATSQGLPQKNNPDGNLYYWFPRNGHVARFLAVSDWARLSCGGHPGYRDPSLGIRFASALAGARANAILQNGGIN